MNREEIELRDGELKGLTGFAYMSAKAQDLIDLNKKNKQQSHHSVEAKNMIIHDIVYLAIDKGYCSKDGLVNELTSSFVSGFNYAQCTMYTEEQVRKALKMDNYLFNYQCDEIIQSLKNNSK